MTWRLRTAEKVRIYKRVGIYEVFSHAEAPKFGSRSLSIDVDLWPVLNNALGDLIARALSAFGEDASPSIRDRVDFLRRHMT